MFIYLIKLFFLYWLNLITLENKTEMKKYNIKGQKDTQKKKKRKMADVDCKGEKVPAFLSVRKILKKWLNLIQFCCVWILALSHQAPYKNLQFLEYWEELFLFLFWRISLTNFSIHWVSHSRLWHQRTKRLFFAF